MRRTPPWTWLLVSLCLSACGPGPAEQVVAAQEAAELGDLDGMTQVFTRRSAGLIQGLAVVDRERQGQIQYMSSLTRLMPMGGVTEVRHEDDTVHVLLEDERRGTSSVILVKESGQWKIDGLRLPLFWKPVEGEG